jgi:hypothetical protein
LASSNEVRKLIGNRATGERIMHRVVRTLVKEVKEAIPPTVFFLISEIVWPRFWANRIVLPLFVLIYASAVELIRVFGAAQLKHLFFGIGQPEQPSPAPR